MVTLQKSLHQTQDLVIEEIINSTRESLRVRLGINVEKRQVDYFKSIGEELLRPNLNSGLARVGYNFDMTNSVYIGFDGSHLEYEVDIIHHMRQYRPGFDPLELLITLYEEGKREGTPVEVAKAVGYPQKDVLNSDEIKKEMERGKIRPLVGYHLEEDGLLYSFLYNEIIEPNGTYNEEVVRSILTGMTDRLDIDEHNNWTRMEGIYAQKGLGPVTGSGIILNGYEADVQDPKVDNVNHSEARFLERVHRGFFHVEFHGHNPSEPITEIPIKVIRPQF